MGDIYKKRDLTLQSPLSKKGLQQPFGLAGHSESTSSTASSSSPPRLFSRPNSTIGGGAELGEGLEISTPPNTHQTLRRSAPRSAPSIHSFSALEKQPSSPSSSPPPPPPPLSSSRLIASNSGSRYRERQTLAHSTTRKSLNLDDDSISALTSVASSETSSESSSISKTLLRTTSLPSLENKRPFTSSRTYSHSHSSHSSVSSMMTSKASSSSHGIVRPRAGYSTRGRDGSGGCNDNGHEESSSDDDNADSSMDLSDEFYESFLHSTCTKKTRTFWIHKYTQGEDDGKFQLEYSQWNRLLRDLVILHRKNEKLVVIENNGSVPLGDKLFINEADRESYEASYLFLKEALLSGIKCRLCHRCWLRGDRSLSGAYCLDGSRCKDSKFEPLLISVPLIMVAYLGLIMDPESVESVEIVIRDGALDCYNSVVCMRRYANR